MNPRPLASALFVLTAVFGELQVRQANGEETYPIKFRISQVGDQRNIEDSTSVTFKVLSGRLEGEKIPRFAETPLAKEFEKEVASKKWIEVFRETVLKTEDSRVISQKRRYQKIQQVVDKFPVEHLIDQDVVIDTTGGDVSCYRENGPELLGDDAAWLREKFRSAITLPENYGFPQVPVKINEPWKIDCKELALQHANSLQPEIVIDPAKSQGTGVLKRVYRRGSVLYGVIRFKFQMPYEQPDEPQLVARRRSFLRAEDVPPPTPPAFSPTPGSPSPTFNSPPTTYDARFVTPSKVQPSVQEPPEIKSDQKRPTSTKLPDIALDEPVVNAEKLEEISKTKGVSPSFAVIEMTLDVPIDGSDGSGQSETRIYLPSNNMRKIDELMIEIELAATIVRTLKWTIAEKK